MPLVALGSRLSSYCARSAAAGETSSLSLKEAAKEQPQHQHAAAEEMQGHEGGEGQGYARRRAWAAWSARATGEQG
jgi:hypothetical protein